MDSNFESACHSIYKEVHCHKLFDDFAILALQKRTYEELSDINLIWRGFMMSTEGQLPTQSHQEGTSDPSRMNLNEILRDVEDLKKGKSSATIEQGVRDNFRGVNSPHHPEYYDNMSTQGYHDMLVHNPYPFHEVRYQGTPQARDGIGGGQGGSGLAKNTIEATMAINKGIGLYINQLKEIWCLNLKHQSTRVGQRKKIHVRWQDNPKTKVKERGRLITNPTGCFKRNGVGHIAINSPIERTLIFNEELNGWIESEKEDFQVDIVDKE
ncbi:hypothetical protein M9H77_26875 [Catharanthus roseus]|uniref:Uncharacterized protein n=1 Tax=Catharanthus roseus TaxID=4058 RepID=A0ACC0ADL9_CATRO|nr:hypothetical protein M9H77_26875 [Catharanthus roseus]